MSTTAQQVFDRAIALIDEIDATTGLVDTETTEDYEARAPYLIDVLQKELAKASPYVKVYEYTYAYDGDVTWFKVTLPTDCDRIQKIVFSLFPDTRLNYLLEGTDIYMDFHYPEDGKIRIAYEAVPTTVTSLSDTLVLSDLALNAMVYGLAKKFVEVEQNEYLVSLFNKEYDSLRILASAPKQSSPEKIINVYGYF